MLGIPRKSRRGGPMAQVVSAVIRTITRGLGIQGIDTRCEIDLERCMGCELCVHLPRARTELPFRRPREWGIERGEHARFGLS